MSNGARDGSEPASSVGLLSFESLKTFDIPPHDIFGKCRDVNEFEKIGRIGQGSYGTVYKAKDRKTNEIVALKKIRIDNEKNRKEGLPMHALREMSLLIKYGKHDNLVHLREIAVSNKLDSIFMVLEYCVDDLAAILDSLSAPFPDTIVKYILKQLLAALLYLHQRYIVHRDVKLSNLLVATNGIIKLADFGLARKYFNPLPEEQLTPGVVTLWCRAPELLLGAKTQTTAVDMWATGCVFGELLLSKPMLPGKSEAGQLGLIIDLLGTPSESIWPGLNSLPFFQNFELKSQPYNNLKSAVPKLSDAGLRLLNCLLMYDPKKRASAKSAMTSSYFEEIPIACLSRDLLEFCKKYTNGRVQDIAVPPVQTFTEEGTSVVIDTLMSRLRR